MLNKLIDKTKSEDILFLSGIILNFMNKEKKGASSSILPELFSTMGIDTTINLIKYFGGENIQIPDHKEMFQSFLIIVCYYKKKVENKDWITIKQELNLDLSPHTLGKLIEKIDEKIKVEIQDLHSFGIEDYINKLKTVEGKNG